MRILVLDDNEILRGEADPGFDDYRDDVFIQTRNVKQFVDRFFRECWDQVWIDHDLGDPSQSGRTATKEIYKYIRGSGRKMLATPDIRVTTMNPSAAKTMLSDLEQCGLPCFYTPISGMGVRGITRGDVIHY